MEMIAVNESYLYSQFHNIILNNELKPLLSKYAGQRTVKSIEPIFNEGVFQRNIKYFEQITFSVTYNCNLQCKYCVYNGTYLHERKKSDLNMNLEIAQKGLDYIYHLIKDRQEKKLFITFYGGEPALNFRVVQKIVEFARLLFEDWKLSFSITTNGTRLNKKMIDFFIKNDFSILFSLDGPLSIQDAKRQYPDGKGSFSDAWRNIIKLRKTDEEYFLKKVFFSIIHSFDLSLFDVFQFFTENQLINQNSTRFGLVNPYKTSYYQHITKHVDHEKDLNAIQHLIKEKLKKKGELDYSMERNLSDLHIVQLDNKSFSTMAGSCDFSRKLLLDPEGKFHICEKMNDKFPVGDVWTGLNFKRMQEISDQFTAIIKNNCIDCQWKCLCAPCYIHFANNGTFCFDESFCEVQQKIIPKKLKHFVEQNSVKEEKKGDNKTKKFHQFIILERGPVNTAILDFLKGNVFQVDNQTIADFENGYFEKIPGFIENAEKEELIISTSPGKWIPPLDQGNDPLVKFQMKSTRIPLTLEIEENTDLKRLAAYLEDCNVGLIKYFGIEKIETLFPNINIEYHKKDVSRCLSLSKVDGNFPKISEIEYYRQKRYNSCWIFKLAITENFQVKPCIFSEIVVGQLGSENIRNIITKMEKYWDLSKDKIEICQDCELKYICFDCREFAYRESGSLCGPNFNCSYNPYAGKWGKSPGLKATEVNE